MICKFCKASFPYGRTVSQAIEAYSMPRHSATHPLYPERCCDVRTCAFVYSFPKKIKLKKKKTFIILLLVAMVHCNVRGIFWSSLYLPTTFTFNGFEGAKDMCVDDFLMADHLHLIDGLLILLFIIRIVRTAVVLRLRLRVLRCSYHRLDIYLNWACIGVLCGSVCGRIKGCVCAFWLLGCGWWIFFCFLLYIYNIGCEYPKRKGWWVIKCFLRFFSLGFGWFDSTTIFSVFIIPFSFFFVMEIGIL